MSANQDTIYKTQPAIDVRTQSVDAQYALAQPYALDATRIRILLQSPQQISVNAKILSTLHCFFQLSSLISLIANLALVPHSIALHAKAQLTALDVNLDMEWMRHSNAALAIQ